MQAWTSPESVRRLKLPISGQLAHEGCKFVSFTHLPPLPPGNIPGTHFFRRLNRPQDHSAAGRIMSMENSNVTIGDRTRDLPACSAVPQPTAQHLKILSIHSVSLTPCNGVKFLTVTKFSFSAITTYIVWAGWQRN